jgi:hypothetical protein
LPRDRASRALFAGNDYTASLAPITRRRLISALHLVKLITLYTPPIETFRAKAVAQFLAGKGQMTVPATHGAFSRRQQFKGGMVT